MKAIQGIMLLTIMLAVSCTNEPVVDPVPPTAEENFVNAINEILVWDSTGENLTASIDENKVGLLGDTYEFNSLVEGSTTQAVYSTVYGIGFIGVELFDDNKQAVMYKEGTVELWDTKEEVSFAPENKMESSAKGEWIAKAQPKSIRINKVVYTMQNNGNLYLESTDADGETVLTLTFKHVSQPLVGARTPDDGKHRDRAIYKKHDAEEYFGLLVEADEEVTKASVYLNTTVPATPFWATEAEVLFDATSKIVIFAEVYYGQVIWDISGSTLTAGYDANGDGAIGRVENDVDGYVSRYFFESVVPASDGVVLEMTRAIYTNALGGFIGVEYIPFADDRVPPTEGPEKDYLEFVMYQKGTTAAWATKDAVVFDATSIVRSSSKGEWVIAASPLITKVNNVVYTMESDGNLYLPGSATPTYNWHANGKPAPVVPEGRTPNDGLYSSMVIYKNVASTEFFGLSTANHTAKVFTVNYQPGGVKTTFWATPEEVVFTAPDAEDLLVPFTQVAKTDEEQFIEVSYDQIVLDVKDKELKMAVNFTTAKSIITDGASTVYTYDSYKGTVEGLSPKYQAIYTKGSKYIGVEFVSPNVSMYRANGTTATEGTDWTTAMAVEFKNETTTVAGWELVGDILTANSGTVYGSCFPSITMDNSGNLYAAFRLRGSGSTDDDYKVNVIKYTATANTWATLGAKSFSTGNTDMNDIVVDSSGNVFASYNAAALTPVQNGILKYNMATSAWENFGDKDADGVTTEYFLTGEKVGRIDPAMIINNEAGVDYIYAISAFDKNLVLKKRKTDGSDDWTQVGAAPFNEDREGWSSSSLVIDPITKHPIVGIGGQYGKGASQNQTVRIATFDGTDWTELGDPIEGVAGANKGASGHSMAVNSTGNIYVAYTDGNASKHHSVKKWENGAWVLVGKAGFTKNVGDFVKIQFYSDDTPVLTIGGSGNVQTVVKAFYFDNTSWKTLGANQVSGNANDYYTDSVIDTREGPTKDMFYAIYSDSKSVTSTYAPPLTVKSRPRVKQN